MQPRSLHTPSGILHYTEWGDSGAAHAVLCAHGLTRNGRDFDVLAGHLAGKCRVLCPDMPGRGKSPWLADTTQYNNLTYLAAIRHLLAELDIARVHWIGTSMGGILGMMAANAAPGLLASLALNDVGCIIPKEGLQRISRYAGVTSAYATRADAEAALRKNCAPFGITDEAHWQLLFQHSIEQAKDGTWRLAYDPAIMANSPKPDAVQEVNLWAMWEAIKPVPTLLIRGEHSDILTRETALAMQAQHPALTFREIENTGHAPALMAKNQVDMVTGWLDGLQKP